jgi:HK97 family phage major capsid protein
MDYKDQIAKLNKDISKAVLECDAIVKEFEGKATPEREADKLDRIAKDAEAMQVEVKRLEKLAGLEEYVHDIDLTVPHKGVKIENPAEDGADVEAKDDNRVVGYLSLGRAYTLTKEYKEGKALGFAGSSPMAQMEVKDGMVPITKGMLAEIKADDVTSSIAGELVLPDRVGEIIRAEDRPLRIRNLLTVGSTGSDTIEYLEETFDNQADSVPEVFTGEATKPKSDIRYEKKTGVVKQLAHYVRISNRMLEDAGQLELMINSRLAYGLDLVEENQLLWGDSGGDDIVGILNTAGVVDYATAIHAVRGSSDPVDTLLDKIRRSRTNVEMQFLEASGVALHPIDYENIELLKGTDARYLWVTVAEGGAPRVWRMPVVETVALLDPDLSGQRIALVGAFKMGAAIFDRSGTNVEVGYANDDFITNYKRIRAEKRLALIVWRPAAFVAIETVAASS